MEPWRFSRYQKPYLSVDDVYVDAEAGGVVIVADEEVFDVAVDGARPAEVLRRLRELRDPASALWPELAGASDGDEWGGLAHTLDILGLLANADSGGTAFAADEAGGLRTTIGALAGWLAGNPLWSAEKLSQSLAALRGAHRADGRLPLVRVRGVVNMPLTALNLQRQYWATSAPLLAAAVDLLVDRVAGADSGPAAARLADQAGGPEEPRDAEAALYGAAALLALSTRPDAARTCSAPAPVAEDRVSGMNLVLAAERAARRALAEIGPAPYIEALRDKSAPASFVPAAAAEEYRITRRFVETIVPALVRRLREPLRGLAFRYYKEEYGHEAYERATCVAMGLDAGSLDEGLPTPYHLAYVDNFIALAQSDVVTHMASVMVTEGLPGDPFGINDLIDTGRFGPEFAEVYRKHEKANIVLAHDSLARLLLAEVPSVSARQAAATLDAIVYLIELTHRAWSLLFALHCDGPWAGWVPPRFTEQASGLR
jgi:hypothetical protein